MNKKVGLVQGRWSHEENQRFLEAIESGIRCWAEVSELVVTRSQDQCRSHYQKMKISLRVQEIKKRSRVQKKEKDTIKPVKIYEKASQCYISTEVTRENSSESLSTASTLKNSPLSSELGQNEDFDIYNESFFVEDFYEF